MGITKWEPQNRSATGFQPCLWTRPLVDSWDKTRTWELRHVKMGVACWESQMGNGVGPQSSGPLPIKPCADRNRNIGSHAGSDTRFQPCLWTLSLLLTHVQMGSARREPQNGNEVGFRPSLWTPSHPPAYTTKACATLSRNIAKYTE